MKVLVTGGAGFIGSHIAGRYVNFDHEVSVLDNLSSGEEVNVPANCEFIRGDVCDRRAVEAAVDGSEIVFHQAALSSVAQSIERPIETDRANAFGTLNVLAAARNAGVRRVVLASSASVYGGRVSVPTPETALLEPRSPYGVSKMVAEAYAKLFFDLYGLETVSLRYFNVYGPGQVASNENSAVVPVFIEALRSSRQIKIHGDGHQARDFTFIDDIVSASEHAMTADAARVCGKALNVGCGESHSIVELLDALCSIMKTEPSVSYTGSRSGDIRVSMADISLAKRDLGYFPSVSFEDGLRRTVESTQLT